MGSDVMVAIHWLTNMLTCANGPDNGSGNKPAGGARVDASDQAGSDIVLLVRVKQCEGV